MRHTGKYSPTEDEFDIDIKINEEAEIAQNIIKRLKSELSDADFNKVMRVLATEYINAMQFL